jgi:outer membrane lipoprotein-sorting protein
MISVSSRLIIVAIILGFLAGMPVALAAAPLGQEELYRQHFNPDVQMVDRPVDGESFITKMIEEAERLQDYSLVFETKTFKKSSTVVERGNLYFKKPKLMRLEETGEFNKGAVAVIGKDGKARAHSGGLTQFVTVTVSPDNKMLDAANGDRMEDSDFLSLARQLKERLKQGQVSRVNKEPDTIGGISESTFVLEVFHPNNPKLVLKRIYVDPKTKLPIRWDDYDYKYPCLSTWKNVKTNTGLSDDLFKL